MQPIKITPNLRPKTKPDSSSLAFGNLFTDHMLVMDYEEGKGWQPPEIIPYGPLSLDPAATVFHYGQEMFEGLKAYKNPRGGVQLFRPEMNALRSNKTCQRLCIPTIDPQLYVHCVKSLVHLDKDWIPEAEGTSLYIRPFIIGHEPFLGVRPSRSYQFVIILSPVGPYYPGGLTPTKLYVEDTYVRSVKGGTGEAKCGGNYAAGLKAQEVAAQKGYEQILWLDGIHRKYIEEIGTSNAFFVYEKEVVTPPLDGTILPGITRDSVLTLLQDLNIPTTQRKITIDEVFESIQRGELKEMFASGTAAVISPVGHLSYRGKSLPINEGKIGALSQQLYDKLSGIQTGTEEDPHHWIVPI